MGDVEIDIPTMETEDSPSVTIEDAEPYTGIQEPETPPPAPKKGLGRGKIVIVILILILGSFGAFVAYQASVSDVTGVQLFVQGESVDGESLTLRVQVNTGFMSTYDGDADIIVEYEGSEVAVITAHIVGSIAQVSVDYEDFFVDNGDYTFTVDIDSFSDEDEEEVVKTANSLVMSSPTPNNRSTVVASSIPLPAYTIRGAFSIYEGANTLTPTVNGEGNGTLQLIENDTDIVIAETDFLLFTSDGIPLIETDSASTTGNTIGGGYVIDFIYTSTTFPSIYPDDNITAYFKIVFTNTYPDSSVTDQIVLEEVSEVYTVMRSI